ncbi:hypothetical protein DRJ22_00045 [Candidatus Woesearchaeota archaeon]|nr:MAG: hypothetical protein B6U93_01410 [Candidatus Woesearchaeota archaeon ex4484_78]RLE47102.1 MAG: hypothetical protein DRJ22_00045 [Candidatus Woesearchaeota archaeon]
MSIAKSLADLDTNPIVQTTLDRTQNLDNIIDTVLNIWTPDLSRRRTTLQIEYINNQPTYVTSLDFLPLLLNLSIRNAIVNITEYNNLRPTIKKTGEKVISKQNRHGNVLQINANKDTHAFSILIKDYNTIEKLNNGTERAGLPRRFNILDDAGNWYDGFNNLEFIASLTSGELELLKFKETIDITFKYFVHPSRAMSIYSAGYLITKLAEDRCADEAKFYRSLAEQLKKQDITLKEDIFSDWKYYFKKNKKTKKLMPKKIRMKKSKILEKENYEKGIVPVLLAKLEHPDFKGEYPIKGLTPQAKILEYKWGLPKNKNALQDILRYCKARNNYLTFNINTQLRACTRAVELAFLKYGGTGSKQLEWGEENTTPGWNIPDWQDTKIKRTNYRALDFENGFRLLYRLKAHEIRVKQKETKDLF